MDRQPVVAGQFYPGSARTVAEEVRRLLGPRQDVPGQAPTLLAMVPHAGWVYSGAVCGQTLAKARLRGTVLFLGPNHTGFGEPLAVWPSGRWLFPGGALVVDAGLAAALLAADPRLTADETAHLREHSLEVIAPFLWVLDPQTAIVPVCVSEPNLDTLLDVGRTIARVVKELQAPVSVVVSSDMSHYVPHEQAKARDALALEQASLIDPEGLYRVVRSKGISMCGVLPMTLGLAIARGLGATEATVAAYATSGDVSGDFRKVVGYAGVLAH